MIEAEPAHSPLVVAKVGGSLLNWSGLPGGLRAWLDGLLESGQRVVLVAGGGPFADLVRELDHRHGLGASPAHWLAIQAMDLTAATLAYLVPGLILMDRIDELVDRLADWPGVPDGSERGGPGCFAPTASPMPPESQSRGPATSGSRGLDPARPALGPRLVPLFTVSRWLASAEESAELPHSWDVTSDSIAARLASRLRADRLVLIKSASMPDDVSVQRAAELGLTDPYFPIAGQALGHVSWLNLRSSVGEKPLRQA